MKIAQVIGSAVSTIKDDALKGRKLLLVQPANVQGKLFSDPYVAVDTVGAGEGELVLVSEGSAGRFTEQTQSTPVDAVIMAILDSLEVSGETTFRKA